MAKGPQYSDPTDSLRLVRIVLLFGCPCFVILSMLWYFMLKQGWIPSLVFVLLLILTLPMTAAAVRFVYRTVNQTAIFMVKTIFADGDIPPPPTYPRQDVLIARGQYAEAADWFRDHIRIEPDDHEARLRLAMLLETHLKSYQEAERLLLRIRNANPPADARQQMQARNHLIDLYRKTGKTESLILELAGFVDRYRGSPQAAGAARELRELQERGRPA
jgi:tetratricopeptide (TPR) repeat protein